MVKKLKALAAGNDTQLVATIRESATQIWLAGLGAFAKAQEEGGKVFEALVKEGESVQDRAKKVADEKFTEVKSKATENWDKLEQVFEDRVERALSKLGVYTQNDVQRLAARVDELSDAVNALLKAAGKPAAKPAAEAAKKRAPAKAPAAAKTARKPKPAAAKRAAK
jgi:poly(hydroxyalkanoate) granule-associated protein